ncbi:amino acid adenylation domain-containing protein [Marinivivus vitaminiproducens]|uniref:amino acid adenylation domain-containing protein n=1 Tax=Marinivivus vitaminiproducens TaxID=3035935 RepID=UPI0027A8E688|nr:amino acid adenylation domain-containing protein [Geminicoccaceae bacterium SCSIO 64248]
MNDAAATDFYKRLAKLTPERRALFEKKLIEQGIQPAGPSSIRRRPGDLDALPLSFSQQRLWFMQRLEPDSAAYNMMSVLRLKGPLDRAAIDTAVDGLAARHEPLRTRFVLGEDNEPRQVVDPAAPLRIAFADLRGSADAEAAAHERIHAVTGAPYDLAQPPFRVALLRLADEDHLLALGTHHIAGDRWSIAICVQELSALYRSAARGEASSLAPLAIQYADWALWQRETLLGARLEEQLAYWTDRLGGGLPDLELPFDRPRAAAAAAGFRGAQLPFALDRSLSLRLRELARTRRVSLFTLLLTAFKTVLHRYTGALDIVVGSEVANRDRPETQGLFGPLVNTLVLRSDLSGDPRFDALLETVNGIVRSGLGHQDLPFERIVEAVNPERRLNELNPLFQAKFDLQHIAVNPFDLEGLAVERYPLAEASAKYELRFNLQDADPDVGGQIEYCSDLFDEVTIVRLAEHYRILLEGIARTPDAPISNLPLMSDREYRATVAAAAGPRQDFDTTLRIHDLFEAQAARTPEAIAVSDGRSSLTFCELDREADAIAAALAGMGAGPERCVGVCLGRTPRLIAALLGVLKAGAAYVALDPDYPEDRLDFIAEDAGLDVVLVEGAGLPFASGRTLRPLDLTRLAALPRAQPRQARADDLAYIIYTSGSTGRPKGVALEHRNAVARLHWAREHYTQEELACVLASSSASFDLSVIEIFAPLAWGGSIALAANLLALPSLPPELEVTSINTVPSLLAELVKRQPLPASVRAVNLAGETMPLALLKALKQGPRPLRIFNLYGPSEDTTYSTGSPVQDHPTEGAPLPIGASFPNTQAYVLDAAGNIQPDGLPGEICIAGAGVARGYLGRPGQTAERFLPDPFATVPGGLIYRSGDRGRRRKDGLLEFLGRLDHQVKVRGFRIETGEVEHALLQCPEVQSAAASVTGSPGDPDRQLVAHVAPKPGMSVDEADLRERLGRSLPAHLVPTLWRILPDLPRLPNGKIDRKALPALAPAAGRTERVAPRDATETRLAQLWSEVLGTGAIGIHDNFFELGGHSLLAIRVVGSIEQTFGVSVPLKALFQSPTVAGLARVISNASPRADARPSLVPDRDARFEPFPLTDIQHAYWLGRNQAFELGSVGAHGYREFDAQRLDVATVEAALQRLIERHDMLRAVIGPDGRQRVLAQTPPYRIAVTDLRGEPDAEARLAAIRERLSHQVFPTDRWPLFHIEAARLDDSTSRFFVSFDVLIGDAWSFRLLGSELAALIAGDDLPSLALTFRDYVMAEKAHEASEAYTRAMAYWQERAETLPPAPELPLVLAPSQIETPRFRRRSSGLAAADWSAFKAHAAAFGLTPASALMAAFAETLARWSRQPRFTLNLTLFNRQPLHPDVERIVGDFTASLLLGIDLAGADSFANRAIRLQDRLWEDLDHRAVSGVRVLRELSRRQGGASAALMPVVFTSTLNQDAVGDRPRRLDATLAHGVSQTPQVYLDHQVGEVGDAFVFNWDTIDELFANGVLDSMFAAYEGFLQSLARDGSAWRAMPVLTDGAPFDQLNQAAVIPLAGADRLLHEAFFDQASRQPGRVAVLGDGVSWTYGEVAGRALALAAALQEAGTAPNELVAVTQDKGPLQVIACLGVLAAGAAYVPIDPALPRERRFELIGDTGARLAVGTGGDWPAHLRMVPVPATSGPLPKPAATKATDLAYVIFTSGSTGRPKGVMIDHRGAMNTVLDINRRFAVGPDDRVFALSSLSFDLSVYDVFGPLAVGAAVVVPDPGETRNTARWRDLLVRHSVTVWNSVPALAQLLAAEMDGADDLPPLRLVMMSGDWIPLALPDALRACLPRAEIVSLGGATEASIWSIVYPIGAVDPGWTSIPYGRPLANQRWYVLDDALRPCPPHVTGRLFIGGVGVARGYWRQPSLTAEKFIADPFAGRDDAAAGALHLYDTGDLGRYRADGTLEFLGREDFQVKINGFRIELGEIEAVLSQHPLVGETVATAVGTPPALAAYVVPCLSDAGQQARFDLKAQQAGLRPERPDETRLALPAPAIDASDLFARQSHRRFLDTPTPLQDLAGLLAALRSAPVAEAPLPKYGYPSAGSLYPVQTYVLVRDGLVSDLPGGWYYHHPARHDLTAIAPADDATVDAILGDNAALAREGAFCLFLVAASGAMQSIYGERARDFCLLEAGYIGQHLMTRAPSANLGLCPLGGIDAGALGRALGLEDDHWPLHALCGGTIDPAWSATWQATRPSAREGLGERLAAFLAERLPAYMTPRDVVLMESLPLTENGKVDRKALPPPGMRRRQSAAPATPAEERVTALWRELLNDPELGVEDHFFEAGGDSLIAMKLLTRLQQTFEVELSIGQLFGALTPRAQAALVTRAAGARTEPAAIPALNRAPDTADLPDNDVDAMLAALLAERQETTR